MSIFENACKDIDIDVYDYKQKTMKEEDADNIGMLYRDGYYKERETNNKVLNDILELHLLKVRNGMLGVINFEYNLQTQTLTQILDN